MTRKALAVNSYFAGNNSKLVIDEICWELLKAERERLHTFSASWVGPPIDKMAEAGFFYLGDRDLVQCVFCTGILDDWRYTKNPANRHKWSFPSCLHAQNRACGNIPINSSVRVMPTCVPLVRIPR